MPLSRDSRIERKVKAVLWARHRLKQRFETIDWQEDVLNPTVEALKAGKSISALRIPEGAAFDIEIDHEDPNPDPTTESE